jgi:hypothetical protein
MHKKLLFWTTIHKLIVKKMVTTRRQGTLKSLKEKLDFGQMQAWGLSEKKVCNGAAWWPLHESCALLSTYIENNWRDSYENVGYYLYFFIKDEMLPQVTKTSKKLRSVQEALKNLETIMEHMESLGFHNLSNRL